MLAPADGTLMVVGVLRDRPPHESCLPLQVIHLFQLRMFWANAAFQRGRLVKLWFPLRTPDAKRKLLDVIGSVVAIAIP